MDDTVVLDDPKFIRYKEFCFYCFGNCEVCKIKFMCWSGDIQLDESNFSRCPDEEIEWIAFGNVLGRVIAYASVRGGYFIRQRYYGNQLESPVFKESDLLYLNDKRMVCCRKRAKPVHHVKNWELSSNG